VRGPDADGDERLGQRFGVAARRDEVHRHSRGSQRRRRGQPHRGHLRSVGEAHRHLQRAAALAERGEQVRHRVRLVNATQS
jgi:hypothetical protein